MRGLVTSGMCAAKDAVQGHALVSRNADEQHAPYSAGWGSEGEEDDEDLMRAIAASLEAEGTQGSLPADFLSCKTTGYLRDVTHAEQSLRGCRSELPCNLNHVAKV